MLLEGVDLAAKTASFLNKDISLLNIATEDVFESMVDEIILGLCFDIHKSIKTGSYHAVQLTQAESPPMPIAGHVDVFGLPVTTITGLPSLKTVPQIECPNCNRTLAASRFAPHLEKCMGMGRNSSRVASRRLANSNKESYREGGHEEEDDDDDEWVEPGKKDTRRRRDKNSPRRIKPFKFKGGDSQDGLITPPQSYDQLSVDERRQLLTTICGVLGNTKVCTRSLRCPAHTDVQRREVRLKWLGGKNDDDIEVESDGEDSALRESLSQLSNASSPAESTVSTSSNPSYGTNANRSKRGDKAKKSKKVKAGSKNGSSRGSTPPMDH